MIYVNLRDILNKQGISINALSLTTGISRNSLKSLEDNSSKMIQFNTMDKLVRTLHIEISDLLKFKANSEFKITNFLIDGVKKTFYCDVVLPQIDLRVKTYGKYTVDNEVYHINWPYLVKGEVKDNLYLIFNSESINAQAGVKSTPMEETILLSSQIIVKRFLTSYLDNSKELTYGRIHNNVVISDFELQNVFPQDRLKTNIFEHKTFIRNVFTSQDLKKILFYREF